VLFVEAVAVADVELAAVAIDEESDGDDVTRA
jgi:hypothetical protein